MKQKKLLLPRLFLIFLSILGFLIFFLWLWFRASLYVMPKIYYDILGISVIFLLGIVWISTFIDILKNNFEAKIRWLIMIFVFGALGSLIYLVKRRIILQ